MASQRLLGSRSRSTDQQLNTWFVREDDLLIAPYALGFNLESNGCDLISANDTGRNTIQSCEGGVAP